MRALKTILAAAALMVPLGVAAQDKPVEAPAADLGAEMTEAMAAMFPTPEPLTPDQQARLPLATALAEKVLPEGSLATAMDGMFNGMLGPLLGGDSALDPRSVLNRRLGLLTDTSGLTDEQAARAAAMLDPQWEERERRTRDLTLAATARMMSGLEPTMRTAIAELYAIHFSEAELTDIDAFFSTPSGAAYARQSYTMASDPRLTGALMNAMPQMFVMMGEIEAELAAATADLPPERSYADLSASERKALARMLGMAEEDLGYALGDPEALGE